MCNEIINLSINLFTYVNRRVLSERNPMKKNSPNDSWVRGILSSRKCGPSSPSSPCPWIRTYHVEYPSERWIVFSLSMDTDGFAMVNYTPISSYPFFHSRFFSFPLGRNHEPEQASVLLYAKHGINGIYGSSTGRVHHTEFEEGLVDNVGTG